MNQIKNYIQKFMYGRYGNDRLNRSLIIISFIIYVLAIILKNRFLNVIAYIMLVIYLYRFLSKNFVKRSIENQKYQKIESIVKRTYKMIRLQLKDKEHRYYLCPHCYQLIRVPKGRGKIEISCPGCHSKFTKKS